MAIYILHIFRNLRSSTFNLYQSVYIPRSFEVTRAHQRSNVKPRHFIPFWNTLRVKMNNMRSQRAVQGCQSSLDKFFMYSSKNSQLHNENERKHTFKRFISYSNTILKTKNNIITSVLWLFLNHNIKTLSHTNITFTTILSYNVQKNNFWNHHHLY